MIIDTREPHEYAIDHVDGAINIPPADLMAGAKQLAGTPKDTELILYCNSGNRSAVCKNILASMGFSNIINGINKDQVIAHYEI